MTKAVFMKKQADRFIRIDKLNLLRPTELTEPQNLVVVAVGRAAPGCMVVKGKGRT